MLADAASAVSPWSWHPHPEVWALVGGLGAAYVLAARRLGPRYTSPGEPAVGPRQKWWFGLGLLAIFVGAEWPVHELAEGYWYSVHMVQHLLFTLVAPPLLLLGTPPWMMRLLLPPAVYRVFSRLVRPLPALVIFNVVVVFTHWPLVVDLSVHSELFHLVAHVVLFSASVIMWWPVASPLPELPRLSYPGRMLYLFVQSLLPTVPASFLTFGHAPLYHVYETFPRLLGVSALGDQRVAGLIMKLVGGAILWSVISVLFFKWYAEERSNEGWDALQFRDVEREVRAEMAHQRGSSAPPTR